VRLRSQTLYFCALPRVELPWKAECERPPSHQVTKTSNSFLSTTPDPTTFSRRGSSFRPLPCTAILQKIIAPQRANPLAPVRLDLIRKPPRQVPHFPQADRIPPNKESFFGPRFDTRYPPALRKQISVQRPKKMSYFSPRPHPKRKTKPSTTKALLPLDHPNHKVMLIHPPTPIAYFEHGMVDATPSTRGYGRSRRVECSGYSFVAKMGLHYYHVLERTFVRIFPNGRFLFTSGRVGFETRCFGGSPRCPQGYPRSVCWWVGRVCLGSVSRRSILSHPP